MTVDKNWEEETLELINETLQEKQRAEQRLIAAERSINDADVKIKALETALDVYRTKYGLPRITPSAMQAEIAEQYRGLGAREMLLRWAETHDDQVVMQDACVALAAIGLFKDKAQAAGTLYPAVNRSDEFEKAARGVYRKKPATIEDQVRETLEHINVPYRPAVESLIDASNDDLEDLPGAGS